MAVAPLRHRVTLLVPPSTDTLTAALEGLTATNVVLLRRYDFPPLYATSVVYRREKGTENWRTVEDVVRDGFGDCEDLAAWRAAELRLDGEPALAIVVPTRPHRWHAVVRRGDGHTIEDPSEVMIWKERLEARPRASRAKRRAAKTTSGRSDGR